MAVNRNLSNCEHSPKKGFFGASTGFEPVAAALALQRSTIWTMKTHTLEAGQFIEFINPWKEWNKEWNYVNCGNTNECDYGELKWVLSRDEFRPGMIKFSFYMSVFNLWSQDESHLARVRLNSSRPFTNTAQAWNFYPRKTVYMAFFAMFHPRMTFHRCN